MEYNLYFNNKYIFTTDINLDKKQIENKINVLINFHIINIFKFIKNYPYDIIINIWKYVYIKNKYKYEFVEIEIEICDNVNILRILCGMQSPRFI